MMKRSVNIRFQYDIGIISVCVDVLRGNEMELRTIVVIRQLQYTRFAFVAFKPREGNSTRQTILRNFFKVFFFVEVKDFVCINRFGNFFGQYFKIKRRTSRVLRAICNGCLNTICTCHCGRKFAIGNGDFRFRFTVYQIYFYDRRAICIHIFTRNCWQRIFNPYITGFCFCNRYDGRNRIFYVNSNCSCYVFTVRHKRRTGNHITVQISDKQIIAI